jgi:hypothetical protein
VEIVEICSGYFLNFCCANDYNVTGHMFLLVLDSIRG